MQFDGEIRSAFRACKRGVWIVGLFSLALNLLMLTVPLYMTSVYDRVLGGRRSLTPSAKRFGKAEPNLGCRERHRYFCSLALHLRVLALERH